MGRTRWFVRNGKKELCGGTPHLTTFTQHVMVGITRSKVIFFAGSVVVVVVVVLVVVVVVVVVWDVNGSPPQKNGWLRLVFWLKFVLFCEPFLEHLLFFFWIIHSSPIEHGQPMYFLSTFWSQLGRKVVCKSSFTWQYIPFYLVVVYLIQIFVIIFTPKYFGESQIQFDCRAYVFFNERGVGFDTSNRSKTSRLRVLQMVIS